MSRRDIIAIAVWAGVMLGVLSLGYCQWQQARTASSEAKLNKNQTGAAIESGADAVTVIGNRAEADAATLIRSHARAWSARAAFSSAVL